MRFSRCALVLCLCALYTFGTAAAGAQGGAAPAASVSALRVGVAGSPPFVVDSSGDEGIAVEAWERLAARLGWRYRTVRFEDVPHALSALESGDVDVVVGPVSITAERATRVRFTQPYFQSSLSILSRAEAPGWTQRIRPFFSTRFFVALGVFILILGAVGTLIWIAEREANPSQFPMEPGRGIANGMWCAIVTMSTTGYGDRAPITFWGRIVTSAWIIISLVGATTMIAGIASTLTLSGMKTSDISTAADLAKRSVAAVPGSPSEALSRRYGAARVAIESPEDGYRLLKSGLVDAVVYDRPQLLYFLKEHPDRDVALSVAQYERQGYGFALPLNTTVVHQVNVALLELEESGSVQRIIDGWLGEAGH
ncbi:MAG TPA: transporter substrate-binding domain-containing protein [Gemmatimonadaceae bacterium]|nr:transporter substrate-binding domain-containing protein [Gemmatimonadaceae bacterium]